MASVEHNKYLDADDSGSDSSTNGDTHIGASDSRTAHHVPKKRKLSHTSHSDDTEDSDSNEIQPPTVIKSASENTTTDPTSTSTLLIKRPFSPSRKRGQREKTPKKPGILYLSRIPPHMRPSALRHLLSAYGPISNLFLTPTPPSNSNNKSKSARKSYTEGWIEFTKKRHAKACLAAINANVIGKRGGWYKDDLLNARYLKGFSWGDLMAGVRGEEREREERIRVGVSKEKREREGFLKGMQGGKVEKTRDRKKGGKGIQVVEKGGESRVFKQSEVVGLGKVGEGEEVRRILGKIF